MISEKLCWFGACTWKRWFFREGFLTPIAVQAHTSASAEGTSRFLSFFQRTQLLLEQQSLVSPRVLRCARRRPQACGRLICRQLLAITPPHRGSQKPRFRGQKSPRRAPCAENETPQLGPRLQIPSLAPLSSPSGAPAASRCSAPRPGTAAETSAPPAVPPHGRGKSGGLRADGSRPARLQPLPRLGRRRPQPGGRPGPPGGTRCGRGGAGRRRGRGRSAGPGRARDWRRERDATSGGGSPASLRSLPGASPPPGSARRWSGAAARTERPGAAQPSRGSSPAARPARPGSALLRSARQHRGGTARGCSRAKNKSRLRGHAPGSPSAPGKRPGRLGVCAPRPAALRPG